MSTFLKDWQLTKFVDNRWCTILLLFTKKVHHIPIAGFLMRWHLVLEILWNKVDGNASITNSYQLITLLRNLTYNTHFFSFIRFVNQKIPSMCHLLFGHCLYLPQFRFLTIESIVSTDPGILIKLKWKDEYPIFFQ